jgi:large subunit ribosomal protein L25
MAEVTIEVEKREQVGKGANRRLRAQELVPAVVYGGEREPVAIQIPKKTLLTLFKEGGHENRIFQLKLAGTAQMRHAMIRDMQLDPLTNEISHIDFQRVNMDKKVRVHVHLKLTGIPYGVKNDGGILDFVTREIEIECLPAAIPQEVAIDVSELHVNQHLEASALTLPAGVTYLGSLETVIASVSHAKAEVVETPEAAAAAPVAAEPEVIKKGKVEEGEEGKEGKEAKETKEGKESRKS